MGTPFLGEIKIVSFSYAPRGWAQCNGQLLPINQNQALFSLLGTDFGGNGQTTFALPDFRGRIPMHSGNGHNRGERAGSEVVTLTLSQLPTHTHTLAAAAADGTQTSPTNRFFAKALNNLYGAPSNLVTMAPETVTSTGGSQPHENRAPFLTLNFIIALTGIFPSQN